jgi:oligopeptidase B
VQPRKPEVEYHLAHAGASFFILTNEDAFNFRVFEAPADNPTRTRWREMIPHRPGVKIDAVEAFERYLVVMERENGLKRIRVIDLLTRGCHEVALDEPVYTVWLEYNPEFQSKLVRFSYSSLTTPRSVYDYDMENQTRRLRKVTTSGRLTPRVRGKLYARRGRHAFPSRSKWARHAARRGAAGYGYGAG